MILQPLVMSGHDEPWDDVRLPASDPELDERIAVCQRAVRFDWVIDVLADYVQADSLSSDPDEFRAVKRREHEDMLRRYQELYG